MDNEDPKNFGRLKLKVPQVYGTQMMDYWAWPKGNFAGDQYGAQIIPKVGDMVWVEFEFGDSKKPIWTHGHFSRQNEIDEKPEALRDINNYWFKTPGGHLVELDDTNKLIRITNTKGYYVEINETGISHVADNISLVKLNGEGNQPAVLGDQNADRLTEIQDILDDILQKILIIAATDATIASSLGLTYAASFAQLADTLTKNIELKTKIPNTKSDKVTLS